MAIIAAADGREILTALHVLSLGKSQHGVCCYEPCGQYSECKNAACEVIFPAPN
jgi:hypothetical protein